MSRVGTAASRLSIILNFSNSQNKMRGMLAIINAIGRGACAVLVVVGRREGERNGR
ncbi:MAG: hypothetical protein KC443_16490 [Anaerolineales bacterium]|nr:hypothetical protein [Anaerolineales bacterium]